MIFSFTDDKSFSNAGQDFGWCLVPHFEQLNANFWRGGFGRLELNLFPTQWTGTLLSESSNSFTWLELASPALQILAAFSSVRSDDSWSSRSFSRVSLTPNTIRSRIMLSCWSPNSHDLARVFSSVMTWSIVSPSCRLHSQNRYNSNTVFFLGLAYSSNLFGSSPVATLKVL